MLFFKLGIGGMFVVLIRPLDVGGRSQSECNMQNIKPHGMPLFPASPEKITLGPCRL